MLGTYNRISVKLCFCFSLCPFVCGGLWVLVASVYECVWLCIWLCICACEWVDEKMDRCPTDRNSIKYWMCGTALKDKFDIIEISTFFLLFKEILYFM